MTGTRKRKRKMLFTFRVEGEVKGKMRPKATRMGGFTRVYTPKAQVQNENWIRLEYQRKAEKEDFTGFGEKPVKVEIYYCKRTPKGMPKKRKAEALATRLKPTTKQDLDNVVKTILDALNGIAYDDDSQVVEIRAYKNYAETDHTDVSMTDDVYACVENIGEEDTELCL